MPSLCRVCQTALETFQPTVERRLYHACPCCQWIALDGAHLQAPEKQKERYLLHENSGESPGYVEMFEKYIAVGVEPFVSPGGRILDFGCGPEPVLARLLRNRGFSVDAYDPFFHPDPAYQTRQYDLILLTEVLEHLTDPLGELRGLSPLLSPGGALSIMTLFHPRDRKAFSNWWYRRDSTHVSFYTLETLEKIAEILGLQQAYTDSRRVCVLTRVN